MQAQNSTSEFISRDQVIKTLLVNILIGLLFKAPLLL